MTAKLLVRRRRLVRVREAQHMFAAAETARAKDEADSIANNARRLQRVRAELFKADVQLKGGAFAAYRELADRLERAGRQLEGALYDANKVIDQKEEKQLEANRDKEIALRLQDRTYARAEEEKEARIAAIPSYRFLQSRAGKVGEQE